MTPQHTIVLEDGLYGEFHAFKHGEPHDSRLLEKLLHLYKPPHITNVDQLNRLQIDDAPLKSQLARSGLISQSIEELAQKTIYKIVLSNGNSIFPHVNIYDDPLQNNYTMTCKPNEPRTKALAHLEALLQDAQNVLICDSFLEDRWKTAKRIFEIFPKRGLNISFAHDLDQRRKTELKRYCSNWQLKRNNLKVYRNHHDRYLLIDSELEVVITSGIDYLYDLNKECTLIFRKR